MCKNGLMGRNLNTITYLKDMNICIYRWQDHLVKTYKRNYKSITFRRNKYMVVSISKSLQNKEESLCLQRVCLSMSSTIELWFFEYLSPSNLHCLLLSFIRSFLFWVIENNFFIPYLKARMSIHKLTLT